MEEQAGESATKSRPITMETAMSFPCCLFIFLFLFSNKVKIPYLSNSPAFPINKRTFLRYEHHLNVSAVAKLGDRA